MQFITEQDLVVIRQKVIEDARADDSRALFGLGATVGDLGVKNELILQSALDRQHVGSAGRLKYDSPFKNAATLAFGIAKNHPYHDGNKRTALVAMLAHLDKNGHALVGARHRTLEAVMENLADGVSPLTAPPISQHTARSRQREEKKRQKRSDQRTGPNELVDELARFLDNQCRGSRSIPYRGFSFRELRQLLQQHGFTLKGPVSGNKMHVYRETQGLLGRKKLVHINTIGWPGEGRLVPRGELKTVRRKLNLEEKDGFDDAAFYNFEQSVDSIIVEYSKVLRRLRNR